MMAVRLGRKARSLALDLLIEGACRVATGLALAWQCVATAQAETPKHVFASGPIMLIVPYAAGGSVDVVGRTLAVGLARELKTPIFVKNSPGAAGAIGTAELARARPDGRVLGMGTVSTLAVLPAARGALGYSPTESFAPIGAVARAPVAVIVSEALGVSSLQAFVELAQSRPRELNYGSIGEGSILHLTGRMFMAAADVELTHVPYTSMVKLVPDLIAGRIHVLFDQVGAVPPGYLRIGALRLLAVMEPQRAPLLPAVPTTAEEGFQGLHGQLWSGLLAPAGTPPDVVRQLNEALNATLRSQQVQATFAGLGMQVTGGSAAAFAELIDAQQQVWRRIADATAWEALTPLGSMDGR